MNNKNSNIENLLNANHEIEELKKFSYDNRNIISWYPFKKGKALIINTERIALINFLKKSVGYVKVVNNINCDYSILKDFYDDIDIVCSNIKDDKLQDKYDYVIIDKLGKYSLEYFLLYIPKLLKKEGKIFYFFNNKLGFDKLIINSNNEECYLKEDIERIIKNSNMKPKFYNVFPNHYVPEIIFSDEYLDVNKSISYSPMYFYSNAVSKIENTFFRNMVEYNKINDFSNSYLVIIGKEKINSEISFVRYNNYRKKEYNLITYYKNNRYYKKANFEESSKFLENIIDNHNHLKDMGINIIKYKKEGNEIFSINKVGDNLCDIFKEKCNKDVDKAKEFFNDCWNKINVIYKEFISLPDDNIFHKYGVSIDSKKLNKLHYVDRLYIDMILQNIIVKDSKYYFFDQEWMVRKAPIEFLLFRVIWYAIEELDVDLNKYSVKYFLKDFGLEEYSDVFLELEIAFQKSIKNSWNKYYEKYKNFYSVEILMNNIEDRERRIHEMEENIKKLAGEVTFLNNEISNIYNSKSWKVTKPLRYITEKMNKKES